MNYDWREIKSILDGMNYHKSLKVSKTEVPPPSPSDGFEDSIGEPEFQIRDVRKRINGTESMHIKEYEDHYTVHRDRVDPKYDPMAHLLVDSPELPIGVAVGIYSGYKVGKAHYDNVKYTSEHPLLESTLVTLVSGVSTGLLTYFGVKNIRELLE